MSTSSAGGLLGPLSVLGHCIHLQDSEVAQLAESRSVAAFCPTSNFFLGSGLFDQARLTRAGARIALATDVGGGTSYSMLRTAAEGYKVLQLNGQPWPALEAFYRMTLGNARALSLDDRIGSIEVGKEADLVALDPRATPALAHRMETAEGNLEVELFALLILHPPRPPPKTPQPATGTQLPFAKISSPPLPRLSSMPSLPPRRGDDRAVRQTYVAGEPRKGRTRLVRRSLSRPGRGAPCRRSCGGLMLQRAADGDAGDPIESPEKSAAP